MVRKPLEIVEHSLPPQAWSVLLVLLSVAAYGNSFPGNFILDDLHIVRDNPLIATLDLVRIFTSDYWGLDANTGLYRPLTILSLALNRALLGTAPVAFHAVNVLLHGLVTLLAYRVFLRLRVVRPVAWLSAALFAVHPIHAEVVNEVVGRAELLCALFVLAALWFSIEGGTWTRRGWVALLFLAGLLAKENAVVVVGLVPILDLARGEWKEGAWRSRVGLYLLLLATAACWLIWRHWGIEYRIPPETVEPPFAPPYYMETLPRLLTALKIQWFYLGHLVWPVGLQGVYGGERWFAPLAEVLSLKALGVVAATGLLAAAVIGGCRRGHRAAWAMALYAVSFAPTSNLFIPIGVGMADRLAYLPSVWFCLAACSLLTLWPRGERAAILAAGAVGALLLATLSRNPDFASDIALWQADVRRDPENPLAWVYLSRSLRAAGEEERAYSAFLRQQELMPDFNERTLRYAEYLYQSGRFDKAIETALRSEAARETASPLNRMVLARAYVALGECAEAAGWLEKARETYGEYALYWAVRGEIQECLGRAEDAIACYRQALQRVSYDEVALRLGKLLVRLDRAAESEEVFRRLTQRAGSADAWNGLGISLAMQGRAAEAAEAFERAVNLAPGEQVFQQNLRRLRGRQ